MGNHEQMMLGALHHRQTDFMKMFLAHGGKETLGSYGSNEELKAAFAGHLKDFFPHLKLFYDDGLRFFVHAGVDHALRLHAQSDTTMLWSGGCTNADIDPGRYVVHGHIVTPVAVPGRHHINIDTGAYGGRPLTAAMFDDERTLPIAAMKTAWSGSSEALTAAELRGQRIPSRRTDFHSAFHSALEGKSEAIAGMPVK